MIDNSLLENSQEKRLNIWNSKIGFHKRKTCMLIITHSCNLNCTYCYEHNKSDKMMTISLVKKIIQSEIEFVKNNSLFNELEIIFMGGEPLMNFNLIKEIVEWIEKIETDIPLICFSNTNGTLLDNERKEWFRQHKHSIVLGLSYDGSKEMQFTNRGTSEDCIDMAFFHELWPYQSLHITVSKETMPNLANGILKMQRSGFSVTASLAQGVKWTTEDAIIYKEQLKILSDTYLNDKTLIPINRLTRYLLIRKDSMKNELQKKFCGVGTHINTYDIDGKKYGCHLFTPLVLGSYKAADISNFDWKNERITEDSYCSQCILKNWCPTCAGFNYNFRGSLGERDKHWCNMALAEALVSCEFQIKYLASLNEGWTKTDSEYAHASIKAYEILKDIEFESSSPYK